MENGAEGILVHFTGGETAEASAATGKHCTNYHAEASTLMHAATMIQTSENNCTQVVFLSDALSVLQAFQNNKLPSLFQALWQVAHTRRTVLQWILAHCGVPGNEQADTLAKRGAKMSQPNNSITYSEKKSIIKALTAPTILKDDYHLLSREQQTVRLRTGHNK